MEPSTEFIYGLQVVGGVPSVSLGWMLSVVSCCIIASPAAEQCAFTLLPPAHSNMTALPGEKATSILLLFLSLTAVYKYSGRHYTRLMAEFIGYDKSSKCSSLRVKEKDYTLLSSNSL